MQYKSYFLVQKSIESFFKWKDSIPLYLCSHLIYKFQCNNCNTTSYGKAERHLKVRAGEHVPWWEKGSITTKNLPLKITAFCQVTCVHFMILPSWIMSHTSLNVWLKNLYLLPRITNYWTNKLLNHWNENSFDWIPLLLFYYTLDDL